MSTEHLIDSIEIFIFGRRFGNEEGAKHGPSILRVPVYLWKMAPSGNFEFTIDLTAAPCFLHRWAQTLMLGIRYRRVNADMKEGAK